MTAKLKLNLSVSLVLVAVNLLLLNVNLRNVGFLRADLTEGNIYSLSDVTRNMVADLEEDLVIKAYFSRIDVVEEQFRPYVTEIRDLLAEYAAASDGRVKVDFITPEDDTTAEEEARAEYGVEPIPYAYSDERQQGVRSFYFGIVVKYAAAKPVTIGVNDLIKFSASLHEREPRVELKNIEFAITRAIKKARFGFESQRTLFARFERKLHFETYISPAENLPELFKKVPEQVDKVFSEMAKNSGGKFTYTRGTLPKAEEELINLESRFGIQPIALPMSDRPFYLWACGTLDDRQMQPVPLITQEGALGEFELRERFEGLIKRLTKGLLKTVGIAQHMPDMDPMAMQMGRGQMPPPFADLGAELGEEFEVKDIDLKTLTDVPGDIDLLLVMEPKDVSEKALFAIDQYVMRGGRVVFCVDRVEDNFQWPPSTLNASAQKTGVEDLLATWGVHLSEDVVHDSNCGSFVWTVGSQNPMRRGGGLQFLKFEWPALPQIDSDEESVNRSGAPFLDSTEFVRFWMPTALTVNKVEGLSALWLLRSSPESWTVPVAELKTPDLRLYPDHGMEMQKNNRGRKDLAVALSGEFPSYFANRPIPGTADGSTADSQPSTRPVASAPIKKSSATRVIVIGNGDWLNSMQYVFSVQLGWPYGAFRNNVATLKNMIDWMLEDEDLIQIRNRGRTFRPLKKVTDEEVDLIYLYNFLLPLALVALAGFVVLGSRAQRKSILESRTRSA